MIPITNASDLNDKQIRTQVAKEYINGNPFRWAMGTEASSIIQTQVNTSKGAGDTIIFSLLDAFDPSKVKYGNEMLEGSEVDVKFNTDRVTVDYVRYAGKVEQKQLVNARTPVEVVGVLRPQIIDAQTQILRDEIIGAFTAGYLTIETTEGAGGALVASASSPHRTRCLFGAVDGNYNATLSNAMGTIDSAADKLSLAMVRIARQKSLNVAAFSNGVSSRKVRPFRVMDTNKALVETFVMFLDPISATHLSADTEFQNLRDTARSNQISLPFFNGSKYLGEAEGTMFYVIEELTKVGDLDAGASSTAVAVNLFCGAQAMGIGIADAGSFAERKMDYEMHVGVGHTIIRGTKRLDFNSIENGVVFVFASQVL